MACPYPLNFPRKWANTEGRGKPSPYREPILAPRSGGFPASAPNSRVLQHMVVYDMAYNASK